MNAAEAEVFIRKLGEALRGAVNTYQYASMTNWEREACQDDMKSAEAALAEYEAHQKK